MFIAAAFGLAWAHACGLTQFANPTKIDWMIEGDWLGHLFGWLFTRNGPWALPLAQAPDLVHPTGSSAALTDAIPILSVIGKMLSPFFGDRMQLFGAWMVLGVMGTGIAGVLVCRPWLKDLPSLALAGCLFVMNPIVSTRYGHPPFFAFWTLTALVGLCVWPVTSLQSARRVIWATLGVGAFACATNGYLAVMASVLVGASVVRVVLVERPFKLAESLGWLASGPAACLGALWAFGFVSGARSAPMSTLAIEGFGQFSADLLTFFNPTMWSRFFNTIPMGPRQYEGFAYLGFGTLVLVGARVLFLFKLRPTKKEVLVWVPLFAAALLMAAYAPSNIVTVAGKPIANFSEFYSKLGSWPSVFRSSGRFVWPLFATLTLIAALASARIQRAWLRQWVLLIGVLLQFVDFDATRHPLNKDYPAFTPFADPAWAMLKDYQHAVIHPIQIQWTCPFDHRLVARLSWEAYRQKLSINSGHVGRAPAGTDCNRHLLPSDLDEQTVYIPYFQPFLADFTNAGFVCGPIEGYAVCVSPNRQTSLLNELLQRRQGPR
ncbi:MAG: hypothetical protein JNM17_13585 [Archangium sp.]|nr:hypothetical protein [Archangium sp.]